MYARGARAARTPVDTWEGAYKRAVEENPDRADILWEWSEATASTAAPDRVEGPGGAAGVGDIALSSTVAVLLNSLYARDRGLFTSVRWSALMRPVIDALEAAFGI
jgi:hypothetical protein